LAEDEQIDLSLVRQAAGWITLGDSLREQRAVDVEYANNLLATVRASRFVAAAGLEIYRARLMPLDREDDSEPLGVVEVGPPPPEKAAAGRLNPRGVVRFYGALEKDTAIAECRPWRRARVSVGRFRTAAPLALADLAGAEGQRAPSPQTEWLGFILGRPVHRDDGDSYFASQWLASECEREGMDGILYCSALRPQGVNVVLFNAAVPTCDQVELYEVTAVSYTIARLSVNDA
jgi:RES domain-containing protein